jgi:hypothetical protein
MSNSFLPLTLSSPPSSYRAFLSVPLPNTRVAEEKEEEMRNGLQWRNLQKLQWKIGLYRCSAVPGKRRSQSRCGLGGGAGPGVYG